jgi:hypothetical protein
VWFQLYHFFSKWEGTILNNFFLKSSHRERNCDFNSAYWKIISMAIKICRVTGTTHIFFLLCVMPLYTVYHLCFCCCCRVKWYNNEDKVWLMYCNVIWRNRSVAYSRIYWVYMTSFNNHFSSVSSELFYCDVKNVQECLWFPVMGDN